MITPSMAYTDVSIKADRGYRPHGARTTGDAYYTDGFAQYRLIVEKPT